ncbi:drug/metabolite transporter (DMT)-like permease [Metabacillus crassostreae]|uniref:DMT family transporter n=1 Tax=Metabacillus crassostreae TaxID=929098 RepID=UPI00195B5577|nr:DMT family transporter [Metabacillus crassostreae]MBM7603502.1 drug/metabolite transporter (DMT)-like permease [Metabacillus crassostreae]
MRKLYSSLVILSIIWGASFLFIKILVEELGPWGVVFWRCFLGTITLCVVLIVFKREELRKLREKRLPWLYLLLVAVFNNTLPFGFIAMSELKISSSFASVINATTPIWTIVIGAIFFKVRLGSRQWLGVFTGFVGILLLLNLNVNSLLKENFIGAGTMLFATFCYGLGAQLARRYLADVPIVVVSVLTLGLSSIISFFLMMMSNEGVIFPSFKTDILFSLIGLGVLGSGIAYLFYYYMVKEGSAEFASLVTYIVPITAMLWGYLLLSEKISANMVIGLFVVFTGVYLSTSTSRKKNALNSKVV